MNYIKISFKNNGNEVYNDVFNDQLFNLSSYTYLFRIQPKTKFWRFGIRLSNTTSIEFYHPTGRHTNSDLIDIHLSVGDWNNETWSFPNKMQLAQYYLKDYDHLLNRQETYVELGNVELTIDYDGNLNLLDVHYIADGCKPFGQNLKIHQDYKYFKLFAWADKIAFDLDCIIEMLPKSKSNTNIDLAIQRRSDIAGLISDVETGIDYLDISKDVAAFSKVIAAKSFEPPLAIALFGKWGSGKSFFMGELKRQIKNLSLNEKHSTYCKGVAHIHFNAWSYMDANLWASIVTKIFEGLQQYISKDSSATTFKKEIEETLTKQLIISQEEIGKLTNQKKSLDEQTGNLKKEKERVEKELGEEIQKIRTGTIQEILNKVDKEFDIQNKIDATLSQNTSFITDVKQLKKIVPEEYWENPKEIYNKISSKQAFLKGLFIGRRWWVNVLWIVFVLLIFFGVPPLISFVSKWSSFIDFSLSPKAWSIITIVGALLVRAIDTYKKFQPLVASIWKIKEDYESKRTVIISQYEQEEKALKYQIKKNENEIISINQQLQDVEAVKAGVKYKIENALSTEALYAFIDKRLKSDDYQKQLGIVSVIRKDFEILSELFTYQKKDNISKETDIISEEVKADFQAKFNKPLERIILYIDDLDRCPEENVVQVLDAVNLLMAYPLFIVIVGVDPRWIKNALLKKHYSQFNSNLNNNEDADEDFKIEPSYYLEKIFQVPFHLKDAVDVNVKNMIKKLASPTPLSKSEFPNKTDNESNLSSFSSDSEKEIISDLSSGKNQNNNDIELEEPQHLKLTDREIELLQSLSKLIGNNPRAIKRFVNIYRIVKTHESLYIQHKNDEKELLTIMFLIAISFGNLKNSYKAITSHLISYDTSKLFPFPVSLKLSDFLDEPSKNTEARKVKDFLMSYIHDDNDGELIKNISLSSIMKYYPFINRFTFNSI